MFAKQQRLLGKDIQYILRRGKKHYGEVFVVITVPQYPNKKFHQVAVQIPIKVDKRAVQRNLFKRHALVSLQKMLEEKDMPYMKMFIFVNKKNIEKRLPPLATLKKTAIVKQWKAHCEKDFTHLLNRIGKK